MSSSLPPADGGRSATNRHSSFPSASTNRRNFLSPPLNHRHTHHNHHQYPNSSFPPNQRRDRPPSPPNFVVQLLHPRISPASAGSGDAAKPSFSVRKQVISTLASLIGIPVDSIHVPQFGCVAGSFRFRQWVDALSAVVSLWEYRLQGKTLLVPELVANVTVPSDVDELRDRLRALFSAHVTSLLDNGDCVKKVRAEIEEKSRQVESFSSKRGLKLEAFEKKKALEAERDLIVKRLEEFKNGMKSIVRFLEGSVPDGEKDDVAVFSLEGAYDWPRIHSLIRRECRRLEDGLPIYAYRRNILKRIHGEQVMVLIGETGSGKSTQLVQFLADSGVAASESIVCTQPRKIAALTLADRVREESNGCYEENSVRCTPAFSSTEEISSKVVFMTDNCLLQHYIKDRSLSGVSCVIIDEAHERSLNTDLLLALLKDLMCRRIDLRLVIMSATADAYQLSDYFFGCGILCVTGRNFPVEIIYSPSDAEGTSVAGRIAPYADDVVKKAVEVHKTEEEGTILAFLTSQAEVEWACERFIAPSAVALPLHGKLSFEEQFRVFQNHPGKRKVIFATNIAETSLTIPGVKYVIDSGMVKESKYEPKTGMSILRVCRVSQSSARQRAGRAGRTEPGRCYRLYSKHDFESMNLNQEPEIRRVHLGVALLRILALGVDNAADFDFVDAPVPEAITMAVRNLVQLGAVVEKNGVLELTQEGHCLVKLGLEPKLGKLILGCFRYRMGKEGIVLAAVMANASSIFCRVGSLDEKMKADCLKVQFCNPNGDLFTLLSVYKEWASLPRERRNKWCWENSLNAKSMRRCEDTVKELEICIERELSLVSPSYWAWNPTQGNKHDKHLKMVILASLAENVAMYTGYDQLGYEVALTGQQVQLHPSCSLLAFGQKPNWVVFGELLSVVDQYLVCVTAFDFEALSMLDPPPPFDASHMDEWRLRVEKVAGCSSTLLKRFCGKSNHGLLSIVSRARSLCVDERISIQVDVDQNEILLYAPPHDMDKVSTLVNDALECEKKWMRNECLEKYIYNGRGQVPMALFGSGAQIKHLEVDQRFLTVDVFYYGDSFVDDREVLRFLEKKIDGCFCSIHKLVGNKQDCDEKDKWGRITFLTPETAMKATEIQKFDFNGSVLRLFPSLATGGGMFKMPSFPSVNAMIRWPQRESTGRGVLKCPSGDVHSIFAGTSDIVIGTRYVRFETDQRFSDSILITNIDSGILEADVLDALEFYTGRTDLEFFLLRRKSVRCPPPAVCADMLHKRIYACMSSSSSPEPNCVQVRVFEPKESDYFMRALITFDGRLHLEAAKALQELDGEVLPGCLSWQKIKCEQKFQSSIICPASVYNIVRRQLNAKLTSFERQRGGTWHLEPTHGGAYRVRISAYATKPISEMRRSLEELVRGRPINHPGLTPRVLQHLSSRDGVILMRRIQHETETYILLDRHSLTVRICGSEEKIAAAEQELIWSLLAYHDRQQLEIRLRGPKLRPDLMKEVVNRFGPDLQGIKEKVNGVDLKLNTRYHVIQVHGSIEMRQEVEKIVYELAQESSEPGGKPDDIEVECPICLCEVDDGYTLEGCSHLFCKACLLEQLEASMRNFDAFPILCSHTDCGSPIVVADLRALLSQEKLDELFRASLSSFVTTSDGNFRFCSTPDCPSVYRVAGPRESGEPFICGACNAETCRKCHLEYHPYITCERYKLFKEDPDMSLKDWAKGKNVKECPFCKSTIEKSEGCNHVLCRCGKHICWVCLDFFTHQEPCYEHMRAVHGGIGIFDGLGIPML
ncbi:helicase domain-containing protein / IBR domain-containing protein / zinc finger protein-related [Raphanus sativus]|uniref:RNA helicase n=1 Tax=Raphanus sativus TaxID=3726 RepID=A0A6J0MTB7_RAPSA|nr:ATP-dependent RNA helicase DEAH12, chloroplastic [Raphanus sativus]KAJ4908582.1 helicase domain-containing protein / IBR domain-containing protein / zinc finger protein-related [Raphanus sativus]